MIIDYRNGWWFMGLFKVVVIWFQLFLEVFKVGIFMVFYIGVGYVEWVNIYLYVWLIKYQCISNELEYFINILIGYCVAVDGNIIVVDYQVFFFIIMCMVIGIGEININCFVVMVVWF